MKPTLTLLFLICCASSAHSQTDTLVHRTLRYRTQWIPARQHNRLVKAFRKQPIKFNLVD